MIFETNTEAWKTAPRVLSIPKAAMLVGVTRQTMHQLVVEGEIPTMLVGTAKRIDRDVLRQYVYRKAACLG